jgi:hypothetical protein
MRNGAPEPLMSPDLLSYYLICFLRYPTLENAFLQYSYGTPGNSKNEKASLEHFFSSSSYSRARKILSNDPEMSLIQILSGYGHSGWCKGNPYLALLNHYLEHFLPVTIPHENQPVLHSQSLAQDSIGSLFLRLLIDFWIDTICISRTSPIEKREHTPSCTDVMFLDPLMPTRHTIQCVYIVVAHFLNETSPRNPAPHALALLQQPIFDLFRGIFASETVDKSLFFLCIRLWHLWLTPWKPHSKTRPKSGSDLVKDALKVVSGLWSQPLPSLLIFPPAKKQIPHSDTLGEKIIRTIGDHISLAITTSTPPCSFFLFGMT